MNYELRTMNHEPSPFVPRARLLEFMRQAGKPHLINLAAGLPSTECVPKADLRKAFDAAFDEESDRALGYHTPDGDYGLREKVAARLATRGVAVKADDLVTTTGCTQALHGMIRLLAQPGEIVACEAPAYYATLEILGDSGLRVLPIPVKDSQGVDLDLVETLFEKYRPKLFVLCSTLSNPSGATFPNHSREALVQICRRTKTHILEDEIYGELSEIKGLRPVRSYDDGTLVSYVTSFSKTVSPGLRVGICLPGKKREEFALLKCQQDMHSSTICEVAFRKYLEHSSFDQHLQFLKRFNHSRRCLGKELLQNYFPAETKIWDASGGFMLWVEVAAGTDIERVYQMALEQKVAFSRGAAFFPTASPPAMRLNCSRPSEEQLTEGIKILGHVLSEAR
jgi:DNA-binding transcriptional MocR family regulator